MVARRWIILLALALARVGFGLQYQTVASLGPLLMSRFALNYAGLGGLIGVYMLPGAFTALPLGLLGRRFGDRLVLGGGLVLMAVGGVLNSLASGPHGIATGQILAGFGAVAMIVMQTKVIADWFTGKTLLLALGVSVSSYPVGVGLAQLVVPPVAVAFGWKAAFLVSTGILAAAAVLFLAAFRPAPHAAPVPRRFSLPGGRECLLLVIAGLIWTAYTAGYSGYTAYVPSLLATRGAGLVTAGLVLTIATWGNVPAILLGGGLAGKIGGLRVFLIGTLALVVGMVGTALVGVPVALAPIGFALVIGLLGSVHPSVIMAVGTLSARPENRAVGLGLFYTTYYAGGAAAPAVCGYAADLYGGPAGALLAAAAISALAVPMYLLHRGMTPHGKMLVRA